MVFASLNTPSSNGRTLRSERSNCGSNPCGVTLELSYNLIKLIMSGQINLEEVLKSIKVSCDDVEYGFATVKDNNFSLKEILGIFQEDEGLTLIATKQYFEKNNILYDGPFAKLTIENHTSLDLVGLTATLSTELAKNEISANVIAAYFHDHIFIQYNLRQRAIEIINSLKG